MTAQDVIASAIHDAFAAADETTLPQFGEHIANDLREHPEAVRSLLPDDLLADIRELVEFVDCSHTSRFKGDAAARVQAWLDGRDGAE